MAVLMPDRSTVTRGLPGCRARDSRKDALPSTVLLVRVPCQFVCTYGSACKRKMDVLLEGSLLWFEGGCWSMQRVVTCDMLVPCL